MNTFLPTDNIPECPKYLDKRRCLKQVVECWQILNILQHPKPFGRWNNHPCIRMWRGHGDCLQWYYNEFYNYCKEYHKIKFKKLPAPVLLPKYIIYPRWLGYQPLHHAYRSNLCRKALNDMSKGSTELSDNLAKMGVVICDINDIIGYNLNDSYIWPVDKNGQLLLEIVEWHEYRTKFYR